MPSNVLAELRARIADLWLPDLEAMLEETLTKHYNEAVEVVSEGHLSKLDRLQKDWRDELIEAKRPFFQAMAIDGTKWAKAEFGDSDAIDDLDGKSWEEPEVDPDLIDRRTEDGLEDYLEETGEIESETTRRQVRQEFNSLRSQPEALTVSEIADRIDGGIDDLSRERAQDIGQTASIWTYNEAATNEYIRRGIRRKEWLVTQDDRTCSQCIPLDGQTVSTETRFLREGETFTDADGGQVTIHMNIGHPPLHPRCRCAIIPVIED